MAQRTTVSLVDDVDGSTADETVEFGVDGAQYEIDLARGNAEALRSVLEVYVASARRTSGRGTAGRKTAFRSAGSSSATPPARATGPTGSIGSGATTADREQNQAVRAWASQHGYPVSARGRIPAAVSAAYHRNEPAALPATTISTTGSAPSPSSAEPAAPSPATSTAGSATKSGGKVGADGIDGSEREQIRAWAQEQGIEVKTRGRLTRDLIANYRATTSRAS